MSLLTVENLRMQFGGLVAVDNVHFSLEPRQIAAIIGPNGAGKTTVFNCISGFYQPSGGQITLMARHHRPAQPPHRAKGLPAPSRTFASPRNDRAGNLLVARHNHLDTRYWSGILHSRRYRNSERVAKEHAAKWLDTFELRAFANHEAGSLAYGQQRRLEIARCMMTAPRVLILDEPAAGLNPQETAALVTLIETLRDTHGISVLLIEHDMSLIMRVSEHIMVMENGRPIAYGSPDDIRNNPDVIKAYLGEA